MYVFRKSFMNPLGARESIVKKAPIASVRHRADLSISTGGWAITEVLGIGIYRNRCFG